MDDWQEQNMSRVAMLEQRDKDFLEARKSLVGYVDKEPREFKELAEKRGYLKLGLAYNHPVDPGRKHVEERRPNSAHLKMLWLKSSSLQQRTAKELLTCEKWRSYPLLFRPMS